MILKDIKNEINKARSERSRDVVDFAGSHKISAPVEMQSSRDVVEKVVEVVEQVVGHLRLLRSQVKYTKATIDSRRTKVKGRK